jgi:hypothetical protein
MKNVKVAVAVAVAVAAMSACAKPAEYRFELTDTNTSPGAARPTFDDDTLTAEIQIAGGAIDLQLTNKTTDLMQIEWSKITVSRGDGQTSMPRPTIDLGWIKPGGRAAAQLVPLVFPRSGAEATAYEGRKLELVVPMIVHREPKTYRFHFVTHVHQP